MNQQQEQLISLLKENNGYIKGYGQTYCRVMSEDHKPIYNVLKTIVDPLIAAGILYRDNLIIKLK